MAEKVVEEEVGQVKLQAYISAELNIALEKYIATTFTPGERLISAVIRKALTEFLEQKGFI